MDAKNTLDSATTRDAPLDYFVKPPADLVVLEGDCLDATGDGGELDSYLVHSVSLSLYINAVDITPSVSV